MNFAPNPNVTSEQCHALMLKAYALLNSSEADMPLLDPWNCSHVFQFMQAFVHLQKEGRYESGVPFSVMFIVICVPMLLLQLTTLPIFIVNRNFWRNVGLRILFANGVADSIQLAVYLTFAILNIVLGWIHFKWQDFGGAIIIPVWSLVVIQHFLLALNRLIVVLRAKNPGLKCIPNEANEQRIFNTALIVSWLLYLAAFALFWSPLAGMVLDRKTMVFRFDWNQPYTQTFQYANWALTVWMPWACLGIYCFIVWTACKFRREVGQKSNSIAASGSSNKSLLNDSERILLIQAIILYIFMAILILCWWLIDTCSGNIKVICTARIFGIELFHIPLEWHSILVEAPWMFFCGLGPILLLALNKEFRARYLQFYLCKSPKTYQINGAPTPTSFTNVDGNGKHENGQI